MTSIAATQVPAHSEISRHLAGNDFHDCYQISLAASPRSALEIYLSVVSRTPAWVDRLMAVRNWTVARMGLKHLGHLGNIDVSKPASTYRVGDRVGIFTLLWLSDTEVILGESDRHLDVKLSVHKTVGSDADRIATSTVVHIHNLLGRAYMLFVAPAHKLIVPAMLSRVPG